MAGAVSAFAYIFDRSSLKVKITKMARLFYKISKMTISASRLQKHFYLCLSMDLKIVYFSF